MSCSSCGTKGGGCSPKGCRNNGTCGTDGCNKLNVYDWLKDMELPEDFIPFNIVEVRFKGSRKEFYRNVNQLPLYAGDYVLVEAAHGFDIGMVSLKGELVRLQLKKYGVEENHPEMRNILRIPGERELERYQELKDLENETLETARGISMELKLAMKISDMEYQADGKKATFFYTAEQRVDFRELIRRYAETFKVKIEMRHIGYRQEASRLGGVGSCGRELCCSTWLTDFRQVNVTAARYQNLSINTLKLSGQCGRLKCCLNFELDNYMEALSEFPKVKTIRLDTVNGLALSQKTDVLKRLIWFCYEEDQNWVALPVQKVRELMEANGRGEKVAALSDLAPAAAVLERVSSADERAAEDDEAAFEKSVREQLSRKEKEKKGNRQRGGDRNQGRGPHNRDGGTGTQNRGPQDRPQRNEQRPPRPDNRPLRNEQRPPRPDNRPPRNEQRPPRPDNRPTRNEQRPPRPDNRPTRNEQRPPRPDNRPPRNEQRPPRPDNRPPQNEGPVNTDT